MPIAINGSGTVTGISGGGLPDGIVDTDMLAAKAATTSKIGNGGIIQVVSAQKTDTASFSGTSQFHTVTGLQLDITPTSSSNKIFVCFNMNIGCNSTGAGIGGKIFRTSDSQNILRAPADGSRTRAYIAQFTCHSNTTNTTRFVSPSFLDSPNTTSQVSYAFQVYVSTQTVFINRSAEDLDSANNARGCCFAYAMEVVA